MPALLAAADEAGVDVAIVTNESEVGLGGISPEACSSVPQLLCLWVPEQGSMLCPMMQVFEEVEAERSRMSLPWPLLSDRQKAVAQRLAAQAAEGRLVLFLGSGVSAGCGLATWDGLLDELAAQVSTCTSLLAMSVFLLWTTTADRLRVCTACTRSGKHSLVFGAGRLCVAAGWAGGAISFTRRWHWRWCWGRGRGSCSGPGGSAGASHAACPVQILVVAGPGALAANVRACIMCVGIVCVGQGRGASLPGRFCPPFLPLCQNCVLRLAMVVLRFPSDGWSSRASAWVRLWRQGRRVTPYPYRVIVAGANMCPGRH
jgi:hypothetical protein